MSPSRLELPFSKIVGTGNDFLFIDVRAELPEFFRKIPRAQLVEHLCNRHFGVGADGVVFIEGANGRLKWDFYNSDGSEAEMCGNATRCVGRWASRYLGLDRVELETRAGVVAIEVKGSVIASHLEFVRVSFKRLVYSARGHEHPATLVNTGVPHAVIEVDDIAKAASLVEDIQALRFHSETGPRGANVTFFQTLAPKRFATTTFERGVENFTLSCGTGVLAAAAVALESTGSSEALLNTPGGELEVRFEPGSRGATLTGPARFLFEGTIQEEFVK